VCSFGISTKNEELDLIGYIHLYICNLGFCSVMVFGFSIHINRIKKVDFVRDHSRIRNLKANNNNNGSKVMIISHMVLGKVI
jgi:hypothetical protein